MPTRYGSKDVTITLDDLSGTPQVITGFVMKLGGAKIVCEKESAESFGDQWREFARTGMRSSPDIPVSGHHDTTVTSGPHVVMRPGSGDADPNGITRTLAINFGGATFTVETLISEYEIVAENGKLQQFSCVLTPTGAAVWS